MHAHVCHAVRTYARLTHTCIYIELYISTCVWFKVFPVQSFPAHSPVLRCKLSCRNKRAACCQLLGYCQLFCCCLLAFLLLTTTVLTTLGVHCVVFTAYIYRAPFPYKVEPSSFLVVFWYGSLAPP